MVLGVLAFGMTPSALEELSGEIELDGGTVFRSGARDAGASYDEGAMAGPTDFKATFHVKGSDCGAS